MILNMNMESSECVGLKLDLITFNDLNKLRLWKNKNKNFFFQKKNITKKQQEEWFLKVYNPDPLNFIFVIKYYAEDVGTIGLRKLDEVWDIYNVMNISDYNIGKGFMSISLNLIINYAKSLDNIKIRAKVLSSNNNLKWYLKNNFKVLNVQGEYNLIEYSI